MQRELIHVSGGDGEWHLVYRGQTYGSYGSAHDALEDARTWVENAERQGHVVQVVIDGAGDPEQLTMGSPQGDFSAAKERR